MENVALLEDLGHNAICRECIIKNYTRWGLSDDQAAYALGNSRQSGLFLLQVL